MKPGPDSQILMPNSPACHLYIYVLQITFVYFKGSSIISMYVNRCRFFFNLFLSIYTSETFYIFDISFLFSRISSQFFQ